MLNRALRALVRAGLALTLLALPRVAFACDGPVVVCDTAAGSSLALIVGGQAPAVVVAPDADPAVRDAAQRFAEDLGRVGGTAPPVVDGVPAGARTAILIGVAGKGGLIDQLAAAGKIDLAQVTGRWEAFGQFVVDQPMPGLDRALVVAGSDRRGAAFGLYDLSEKIGVSPWYWWADVPVAHRDTLYLTAGARSDAPAVKYRGFFINDEDPSFGGWARTRFGGVNAQAYEHVFELLLRLKGNYLWPAMWGKSIAEDDPQSLGLAARMGVVLGTSHHEPLTRAHVEWERAKEAGKAAGEWNYATNAGTLQRFWREGIERANGIPGLDYVATVGMRGDGDEAMSEGTAIPLLERIVADQRGIIQDVTGRPAAETPQVWALYKEVQDYYDQGMRVPDDVTLLFSDDNWGQIRRLPDLAAAPRAGSYGVYYHYDYVGGPRSYRWQDTNQVGKVWQQMDLAWQRGARQLWVVNVGDIKPMEYPLQFFMDQAWNPPAMTAEALAAHPRTWAAKTFGEANGEAIGALLVDYGTLVSRRKPELLDSQSFPPEEYRALAAQWDDLVGRAARARAGLRPDQQDAYFELVEHRVLALANLYRMYAAAAFNAQAAGRDPARAEANADAVELAFARDRALTKRYHAVAGGKWAGMMAQTHIGYTDWNEPPEDVMPAVVRGGAAAAAPLAPSEADPFAVLAIPASGFARAQGGSQFTWTRVPALGPWGEAPLALPQGKPATTPADGVFLEYDVRFQEAGDYAIELLLAPTLDTMGSRGLRIGLSLDGGPVRELVLQLEPTNGEADTPPRAAWVEAVSENEARVVTQFDGVGAGTHRVRLYRIDDNVIPQALLVRRAAKP